MFGLGTWAWQNVRTNATTDVFLAELREATWYELKMKACNSAGCGNQSSQFATLDYDGSEWRIWLFLISIWINATFNNRYITLDRLNIILKWLKLIPALSGCIQAQSHRSNPPWKRTMMSRSCFLLAVLWFWSLLVLRCSSSFARNARKRGWRDLEVREGVKGGKWKNRADISGNLEL